MNSTLRLPITVLTGYLGSGKTTLLNRLIRQPSFANALVIINEFGEIGIDHELVAHSQDEIVVELSSGCLCCTIRGDLKKTLRDAPWRFARNGQSRFDQVLIETTGLADPMPILHTLITEPEITERYWLQGLATVVDAVNGADTFDRHLEALKQVAVADRLLISKTDLATDVQLDSLKRSLARLNPTTPRCAVKYGDVDAKWLTRCGGYDPNSKTLDVQRWLDDEASADHHGHEHEHEHEHDINRHSDTIKAHHIVLDQPLDEGTLRGWLGMLQLFVGPSLLRVKGLVHIAGEPGPTVVHGVQHVFHPLVTLQRWPSDDRRSRIVFITCDIEEATLRKMLDLYQNSKPV